MARILVVDDDPHVCRLIRELLGFAEHEVIEAREGAAAIALASQTLPDLVILDLGLIGAMDGVAVLHALKATPGCRSRFLVLTGSGAEREGEARAAGAHEFLTKPFSPLDLIKRVEASLVSEG